MEILHLPSFQLENKDVYYDVPVGYTFTSNHLSKTENVVLVLHGFSGDSEVTDWWGKFVGDEKLIDTRHCQVLCINTLGGCSGSFGPKTLNPATGECHNEAFPQIAITDMANFQLAALKQLGITKLQSCIAISMGGLVGMEMLLQQPTLCQYYFQLAATPQVPFEFHALNIVMKEAILLDPSLDKKDGMGIARKLGMIFFQTNELNEKRFGSELALYAQYLERQKESFHERFHWVSYVRLLEAMEHHTFDYANPLLAQVKAKMIIIAIQEDRAFPYSEMKHLHEQLEAVCGAVDFYTVSSLRGHDSFLLDPDQYQFFQQYIGGAC